MLDKIRSAIASELVALGAGDVSDLRETILIRDGLFCGRKFLSAGFTVVWFMEENEIKFFSPAGQLLIATTAQRCLATDGSSQIRRAA